MVAINLMEINEAKKYKGVFLDDIMKTPLVGGFNEQNGNDCR